MRAGPRDRGDQSRPCWSARYKLGLGSERGFRFSRFERRGGGHGRFCLLRFGEAAFILAASMAVPALFASIKYGRKTLILQERMAVSQNPGKRTLWPVCAVFFRSGRS